jgi:branched-chain amino acid transport system substrate-binding protein
VVLALIVLGGALVGAWWFWLPPSTPETVRIGLAINLSGHGGTAGEYVREGAMLAVEEANATGGVHGRALELLIKDDKNTPEGIIEADQALIEQGVLAIIGHATSQSSLIAYPVVTAGKVLLFTPYTATTQLSGKDDLFLRTCVDVNQYAHAMAALLRQKQVNSAAFLLDMSNPSFVSEYFQQTAQRFSGQLRKVEFNPRRNGDWDPSLDALLAEAPDAIVLLTEVSMTGIAAQKLRARGFDGPLIATLWAQSPDLMRFGGSAVEGLSLVTFIDPENNRPGFIAFSEKMRKRLHRPANARSTRAYEAVSILVEALRRSSPLTVEELKKQLLSGQFDTLMGLVRFDRFGDVQRDVLEVQVRNGRFSRIGQLH